MTFEEYLIGKKIDSQRFREQEPEVWIAWEQDFKQQHPASFSAQKLYLINPLRRKYHLKPVSAPDMEATVTPEARPAGKAAARPVFKSKPKM
ncbi:MAG TPA: hypothetical protein VKZ75_02090 [Cyclobacteriaceae bacterium]|nr:hypothetical protein [Cyclobacteriaceae bacterium]